MKVAQWIQRLGDVWVEGQLTQINARPNTATAFLVLRDPAADISLTLTCSPRLVQASPVPLAEGSRVIAHGTPTFFLTYDQRTQEMADTFELPSCPVTAFDDSIDLHEQNWSGFEKRYQHYFGEMRRVLDECGVAHRLEAG